MIMNSWINGTNTLWRKRMPFKSKAQRKYLHSKKPKMAKKWEKKTPKGAKLPKKVRKTKNDKKAKGKYNRYKHGGRKGKRG